LSNRPLCEDEICLRMRGQYNKQTGPHITGWKPSFLLPGIEFCFTVYASALTGYRPLCEKSGSS
ncbi:hypothetical protein, partial [Klebsiella pneumoniae]|uniref:hypothetical protein n=1 Tax=Klebsiella pneumoniae TaxID=573 RepID=UPI001C529A0E